MKTQCTFVCPLHTKQGRTQGGVGVKTPLQLDILRKVHYLRKGD